jgi:glycosyltransferase involved in cell wall biosynthesis
VSVLPSVEDGYGLVLLQSLASGCPIIASTNTGGSECVVDGKNGFLVPIRSAEAIAEKITKIYEHPEERDAMRNAALESVRRIGGWHSYGDEMVKVYSQVLHS